MRRKVYTRNDQDKKYDERILTKLLNNYRSHPEILVVPNRCFYKNELEACADELERTSLCHWEELPKKGFPIIFHGVYGEDVREETSPSFFNPKEIVLVEEYVKKLLEARSRGMNVKQEHIGIITPYRKQVGLYRYLSHLGPIYSNLIGPAAVIIYRIVFQACPHGPGLYGIISTM